MKETRFKRLIPVILILFVIFTIFSAGVVVDRLVNLDSINKFLPQSLRPSVEQRLIKEESVVTEIAEKASPSVVTVSVETPERSILEFSPFGGFRRRTEGGEAQDIGSGFVVSKDGLIVTNKHVVGTNAKYKVITSDDKEYEVKSISRDPNNDIAVLKIDANDLKPLELGASQNLKVGQFAIAIGTALGEFRHTVTTGVISGLGRGITAGSAFEGYVERLDDVIQTDAAINPGNSGGPLLNSAGQVIGINVAVAQGAQNIGFAIPVNVVKEALGEYNSNGGFQAKAYLGVRYEMIPMSTALLNGVPQGAYVIEVVEGSPAEKAGIKIDDIITKIDGKELKDENNISEVIKDKKVGDSVSLEIYRNKEKINLSATLSEFSE